MIAQLLDVSLIPTFAIDHNHLITHWNIACEQLTGLQAAEMIGTKRQWQAFYKEEKQVLADLIVERAPLGVFVSHFAQGVRQSKFVTGAYEAEIFFPDISHEGRWYYLTASPLKDAHGTITGALTTLQDITCHKPLRDVGSLKENNYAEGHPEIIGHQKGLELAECQRALHELRQREKTLRIVAESIYDWEYWINPEGKFIYISPSCERITGYGIEDFQSNSGLLKTMIHPDDMEEFQRHYEQEMTMEDTCQIDFRIINREGREVWISHICQTVTDEGGNYLGRRASNRDITKRKRLEANLLEEQKKLEMRVQERTEQLSSAYDSLLGEVNDRKRAYMVLQENKDQLRKRKEFIETILDNLPIGLAVGAIRGGAVYYMNDEFSRIHGWPKEEIHSFDSFFWNVYPDPKYRKAVKKKVLKGIVTRNLPKMVWRNLRSTTQSGEQRFVTIKGIPLVDQDLMILTAQDVTEKRKATEALLVTRFSIDHANDMVYWVDANGKIVDVNETTCKKLGRTRNELLSMTVMDIDQSLTLEAFFADWKRLKHLGNWRVETCHYCKNGEAIPVETHVNHITFSGREYNCVFARDITERRELERLVTIQDKMGSLGRVAAGIAHEIRNPLSTINVYLSTLKRLCAAEYFDMNHLSSINESIEEMDRASHKIETVVKRVMDFSKPSQHKMQIMNVNQCVKGAVDLSAVTLRKSGVLLELSLNEKLPECYMDSQLIEQMMLNLITNAIEEMTEPEKEKKLLIKTGERTTAAGVQSIVITVADSGSGVASELRGKIFDPFFTTKHYGSGIGLSICHRIISDHQGTLHVSTSKWGGALFTAAFPVKKEVAS
ncbi:PAS domain-containing sensor histidine kinase [Desulforhopalus sp. IMCC35007]|uniref:PAS domain-containing sensor histidine kinase n=1 Tax=Desulforhopalus sp. IMCC35007 TaxID=2569543 RepID=UPI0010AE9777|nr:PAS domain-containing sensor histidine kinase [Desulforhopalus sp. IMCC35007]TKB06996.1 PAS domain S-box protein [Desulforhopalus sp. IMCC35007]